MDIISVCERMIAVYGHDGDPESDTNQTISPHVKPVLHWFGIMFDHRTPLAYIDGLLTVDRYVTQVVDPVFLSLSQSASNMLFQQDVRPRVAQQTINNQTGFDILPWPANSSDLNHT
ncbi:hypothetical protein TNCV_2701611 [Trichonephila clavipes]|nr:hypothetical protein TNCV_2701611 [Trichonephila clavipes]